ncbi:MAG: nucleotidyl transferase AbiEii/AbiGii toxin family protein [Lentisphaerota bacterium]
MHENVLPRNCLDLLKDMETSPSLDWSGWTLAGGTGLALRYGHRLSVDLDFFRTDEEAAKILQTFFLSFMTNTHWPACYRAWT